MNSAVFIATLIVVVGVSGYDQFYMNLITAQMTAGHTADKDIPGVAKDLGLSTLLQLVTEAGLAETLSGSGPFTVFGPTDAAFAAIPKPFFDILSKNKTLLAMILEYHVVSGKVLSTDLTNDELAASLDSGLNVRINIYEKDGQKVITASGRKVSKPDQEATNGVIHVVDNVLYPPPGTLVDVAAGCPYFSTLAMLVGKASLVQTLSGAGPFTLFAPTDKAFKEVNNKTLAYLESNIPALTKVLKYHVVSGTFYSAGLSNANVTTVEGSDVTIKLDGGVMVNTAKVEYADLTVTNGVFHAIDKVLIPPDLQKMINPTPRRLEQFLFKPFRL